MSDALNIVNECLARITAITTASGYQTNMGNFASIAERQYNFDEVTRNGAVNVFDTIDSNEDDETVGDEYIIRLDLNVEGHIRIEDNNPVILAHSLLSDIKKAMLLTNDRTMDGLVLDVRYSDREINYPESSGDIVSVRVGFYVLYTEDYGSP